MALMGEDMYRSMTLQKMLKESQRMLLRSLEAYYGGRRHPISGELPTLISSSRILLVLSKVANIYGGQWPAQSTRKLMPTSLALVKR
jgi:hypothetical protein